MGGQPAAAREDVIAAALGVRSAVAVWVPLAGREVEALDARVTEIERDDVGRLEKRAARHENEEAAAAVEERLVRDGIGIAVGARILGREVESAQRSRAVRGVEEKVVKRGARIVL